MSNDLSRVSLFSAPGPGLNHDSTSRLLDRLRVYVDGKGGATGSQKLRAVAYHGDGFGWTAGMFLDGVSREVTVTSGTSARWVDFRFDRPVFLGGWDGASYQFGLLSGGARNVARYATTSSPAALWWGPDSYADGALAVRAAEQCRARLEHRRQADVDPGHRRPPRGGRRLLLTDSSEAPLQDLKPAIRRYVRLAACCRSPADRRAIRVQRAGRSSAAYVAAVAEKRALLGEVGGARRTGRDPAR